MHILLGNERSLVLHFYYCGRQTSVDATYIYPTGYLQVSDIVSCHYKDRFIKLEGRRKVLDRVLRVKLKNVLSRNDRRIVWNVVNSIWRSPIKKRFVNGTLCYC